VDTQHPEVIKDMQDWGVWIITECVDLPMLCCCLSWSRLDAAGFRFDAARHMSVKFLADFIQHVRDTTGKDIFGVG
jgi:alpha-amylase